MTHPPTNFHLDKRAETIAATIDPNDDNLLNTREVAHLLGVSVLWLELGRRQGYGPPFMRLGERTIRYRRDVLRAWLDSRTQHLAARSLGEEAA